MSDRTRRGTAHNGRQLWRRLRWRAHWVVRPSRPFTISRWWNGMTLTLPHSGAAATAFYRTFPSESIAAWMRELLRPGMAVVDVGAHAGVYSMLAAHLVGPSGVVQAVEPQAECVKIIEQNAALNRLS